MFYTALQLFLSAVITVAVGAMAKRVGGLSKKFNDFMEEHRLLMETERNDLKSHIVAIYERAKERGYITHMELDTVNRLHDSYKKLGGNSYIDAIVHEMNYEIPKVGMPIPAIVTAMNSDGKEH